MVSSGGGGSSGSGAVPQQPIPQGQISPFGQSTPFNPTFQSVLGNAGAPATMDDLAAVWSKPQPSPMAPTAAAGGADQSGMNPDAMRTLIAKMMMEQRMKDMNQDFQNQRMAFGSNGGGRSTSSGYGGSASGGPGGFGGSSARGGRAY